MELNLLEGRYLQAISYAKSTVEWQGLTKLDETPRMFGLLLLCAVLREVHYSL